MSLGKRLSQKYAGSDSTLTTAEEARQMALAAYTKKCMKTLRENRIALQRQLEYMKQQTIKNLPEHLSQDDCMNIIETVLYESSQRK